MDSKPGFPGVLESPPLRQAGYVLSRSQPRKVGADGLLVGQRSPSRRAAQAVSSGNQARNSVQVPGYPVPPSFDPTGVTIAAERSCR